MNVLTPLFCAVVSINAASFGCETLQVLTKENCESHNLFDD